MKFASAVALLLLLVLGGVLAALLLWQPPTGEAAAPSAPERDATPRQVEAAGPARDADTAQQAGGGSDRDPEDQGLARSPVLDGPAVRGRLVQSGHPMGARTVSCVSNYGRPDAEVVLTVTTDDDGRFALRGLAPSRVSLAFEGPGVPEPWVPRHVTVSAERDDDLGDLEVPVPGSLRGRVVDEHAESMAGVAVFHNHRPGYSSSSFDRGANLASVRDAHVTTDLEGRFSLDNLPPGEHFVLVEPAEHVDREERVELVAGAHHDLGELRLTPGRRVSGQVFDERGAALAGALVAPAVGLYSTAARRKGTITGTDGCFELRGLPTRPEIRVELHGFVPHTEPVAEGAPPLVIELQRALTLVGRVSGHDGRPTTVELEGNVRGRGSLPPRFAYAQLHKDHEVALDGSFRIDGLGPGKYLARAATTGVGHSVPVAFTLPRDEPLSIEIVPDVTVEVQVVDDLGAPIAGARVVRDPGIEKFPTLYRPESEGLAKKILSAWRRHKSAGETDARGIAHLPVEPDVPLALAAEHQDHLPAAAVIAAGEATGPVRIELTRAGRLGGELSDASGRTRFSLAVRAWPAELAAADAQKQSRSVAIAVDAQGRFHSEPLQPGRYRVAVYRFNMTWDNEPTRRLPNVTPLLGAGVDPRQQAEVEVVAGEEARVDLETPPLGRLHGTVRLGSWPAPSVAVWAVEPGQHPRRGALNWDTDDAYESAPFTRTDAEGRFELLFADVGAWDLYARHADAAYPTGPVRVNAPTHAADVVQDIALHGAEVRGRYDVSGVPEKERKWFAAYLFRLERASDDAFFSPHHGLPKSWGMRTEPVGTTGSFAFRHLPPGVWVLRLVNRSDRIVHWQIVETADGQTVDLGEVAAPAVVDATVACGDAELSGAWLRKPAPGSEKGLFVATLGVGQGKIQLSAIPPGTYTLEGFRGNNSWGSGGTGKSIGPAVELTVRSDGTTVPGTVFEEK